MQPLRVSLLGPEGPVTDHLRRAGLTVTAELGGDVVLVLGADTLTEQLEDRLLAGPTPVLLV